MNGHDLVRCGGVFVDLVGLFMLYLLIVVFVGLVCVGWVVVIVS